MSSVVRPRVDLFATVVPFAVAMVSCLLAGLLPARLAVGGSIVESLRTE